MSDSASTVRASDSPVRASRRQWLAFAAAASASLAADPLQARTRKAPQAAPASVLSEPVDVLPAALRERLSETGLAMEGFGLHVQPLDGTPAVLSWQAARPFVLASTSKLITSMAALDLLGPTYRWRTRAYLSGPLTHGRLLGDLVIRGGGDASLTSQDLLVWFQQLREQGLHEVWGDIILNREAFSLRPQDLTSTPEPTPERPHHVRPDALALDAGVVRVAVQSDSVGRANIQVTPPLHDVKLINALGRGGACVANAVYRDVEGSPQPQLQINGQWSARCGAQQIKFSPVSMRDLGLRGIEGLWLQAGGVLRGRVVEHSPSSPVPWQLADAAPFSEHVSAPLSEQLIDMNKRSDNLVARHLMLSLAPEFPNRAATAEAAQVRVRDWLTRKGVRKEWVGLDTGSGLSRLEKATPQAMVHLLSRAARGPQGKLLLKSLPIAGVDGTLEGRLRGGVAEGQAWLKTGTLLDTRGLAGYVRTRSGRMLGVCLLANHAENVAAATPALDACVEWAARLA
ncbi:D-alanyl-D-alanine carboxypeptidase/D-alanyl-D-alanine-endopeptidase [Sphaerotilus sp.]|uniref:D-alanyl-D-alanine carboxypeptidase/D-alanyl-D-alanine endopeptidase n=1 Tax=Sphaerotilus sp. TaxID=2093942 RepID=UPI00286DCE97|nr:D-alanyl-D-alanine carboxypeptidase/D-alanyl-D-alanine-endopeptidase [Sphaerotilus sp.]